MEILQIFTRLLIGYTNPIPCGDVGLENPPEEDSMTDSDPDPLPTNEVILLPTSIISTGVNSGLQFLWK